MSKPLKRLGLILAFASASACASSANRAPGVSHPAGDTPQKDPAATLGRPTPRMDCETEAARRLLKIHDETRAMMATDPQRAMEDAIRRTAENEKAAEKCKRDRGVPIHFPAGKSRL